jgi:pyridoxal phosphate phosphatase PHOSPHO2
MAVEDTRQKKILVAFDFDHTVIDGNSDTHITHLCPEGDVPPDIKEKFSDKGWTHYMAAIFKHLHKHGIQEEDIRRSICEIPLTEGICDLMKYLESDLFEVIIISDSNSVFIDYSVKKYGLERVVDKVYTNPAKYDNKGLLTIEFYHTQDWCTLSTENLCKGHILDEHIKNGKDLVDYAHVLYVGDGTNDLCPALRLFENDYIFPRKQYSLWKKLKKLGCLDSETSDLDLKAKVVEWSTGREVLDVCKELASEINK